jgi:hypothetical protein
MNNINDQDQLQIMLDLETLSLAPHAVIVSIGATKFTLKDGIIDTFSINVDPLDGRTLGLDIDPETINWWKDQPKEISDMWKVDPKPVKDALTAFCLWYGGKSLPIWANSPSMDCVVIKESMKVTNTPCPWNFRDECDYRTLNKLLPIEFEKGDKAHSSLDDAIYQTKHLLKIFAS